ncbi:MAG: hypothetical protein A3H39_08470 [candidate division NC10 bacterium RIFCSPLOWO2_02_FULL_66_22]|nr:MAG: hypothetical protein A3H39_08470 [candidate division NC10 bacterium RIFCSPLOWO2_02_FULL_66_22]
MASIATASVAWAGLSGLARYTASSSVSDSGSGSKSATVNCPKGKVLTGAGGEVTGGAKSDAGKLAIQRIVPADNLAGMVARGVETGNQTASNAWKVTGYALCVTGTARMSGLVPVWGASKTDSLSPKLATATCPPGKSVIGAGGQIKAPVGTESRILLTSIWPSATKVEAGAQEIGGGTGNAWRIEAVAICADTKSVPGVEISTGVYTGSAPLTGAEGAKAFCKYGQHVTGGGFAINAKGKVALWWLLPVNTLEEVNVAAMEIGSGTTDTWTLHTAAICVPGA